jgi:hypothetical protein
MTQQNMHQHSHQPHTFCVATIVYNILVIVAEVILQVFFTSHDIHEAIAFEVRVQVFHLIGIVILGAIQWWIIHKIKHQTNLKFTVISLVMIAVHMIVLHGIPRLRGISIHHHESGDLQELYVLVAIVLFVTVMFWKREDWLKKMGLKNKRIINFKKIRL